MDAGLAGIVGAAIGGVVGASGAVISAYLAGSLQGRSQFTNWRRQVRRDTSASFLATALDGARTLALAEAALQRGDLGTARAELDRYHPIEGQMVVQGVTVAIEGPPSLDAAGTAVKENLMLWGWSLREAIEALHARGAGGDLTPDEQALLQQVEGDFNGAGEAFILEARRVVELEAEQPRTVGRRR